MQTDRKEWLDKLKSLSNSYKVVIIQGLRRIGKTLLMNNLAMDKSFLEYKKYHSKLEYLARMTPLKLFI